MLDIKLLRKSAKELETKLKSKEPSANVAHVLTLDDRLRELKTEAEAVKSERNTLSKEIGELKRKGGDATVSLERVGRLSDRSKVLDHECKELQEEFDLALASLPNIPLDTVKVSDDPAENEPLKGWGEKPAFDFQPCNHLELNEKLNLFDFKRGAKLSGHGWPVYTGMGARIEWALLQYMMGVHIKNGFTPHFVPHCVRPAAMFGSGQLPKFENQAFKLADEDHPLYLIPTAEVSLNGLYLDEIIAEGELPKRIVSFTPCYRREAGAAGAQERGLIRVHQFNKIEMFCFCCPEESPSILEEMVASAEEVLQGLGMHYRIVRLVTGDMSFSAAITLDIEVFLPGQGRYYEVSSLSNCTDFQARRSNTRLRRGGEKPEFLHTLNGSGLATSRLLVGLLENNQHADGSVTIPEALRPYVGGQEKLTAETQVAT